MKYWLFTAIILLHGSLTLAEQSTLYPVQNTPQRLSPLMERELRGCFDFFWEEWNDDPKSPTYGMSNGAVSYTHLTLPTMDSV